MFTDGPFWPSLLWVLPLLLIGAVWLAVAVLVNRGEDVDRPNRMAHLYGYTVCLISLVVGLITLASILGATFDRANPLQSDNPFGTSLASFESYKATYRREQGVFERGEVAKKDSAPSGGEKYKLVGLPSLKAGELTFNYALPEITWALQLNAAIIDAVTQKKMENQICTYGYDLGPKQLAGSKSGALSGSLG